MECEMCGSQVQTRKYMVDGTMMSLGLCCSKYGQQVAGQGAPAGSQAAIQQGLQRRATRTAPKSVYEGDSWELVENFGPKIRQARERKKLTKEFLGGKVAARVPQLNQIESGHLRPSDQLARALERELGITLLEKVDETQAHQTKKVGGAGLTIGDLIKDERKK